ncbi:hypothetical protein [Jannaschia seohaensis]|uniref:Uncharacterized protein n=1 Tax=Jannaschia seohaensis TaxID=475081 RepID=A0A2Y9A190_9RHOB|nr:hypothetical protein [Jannaschia seohaensis]PWJ21886.1 hypothetical protein BCF38_101295 [Jannaschia seohaensis]SSA38164.1 hypothetical protein SAMN05421539_101295 [Jannaschia seohaensis]
MDGMVFLFAVAAAVAVAVLASRADRRRRRRRASLRQDGDAYVWVELDGSERRSSRDPRPGWDREEQGDADGGDAGDGGGGD